jgi:hypothetical protein
MKIFNRSFFKSFHIAFPLTFGLGMGYFASSVIIGIGFGVDNCTAKM